MTDILEIRKKIKSNNVLLRSHWSTRRTDKKEYALLVRSQMRLKKIVCAKEKEKYIIMIISYRKRLLDKDNLYGGCKQLIDAIIDEGLIYDDSPKYLDLKVEQFKAKEDHTMIIRKGIDEKQ